MKKKEMQSKRVQSSPKWNTTPVHMTVIKHESLKADISKGRCTRHILIVQNVPKQQCAVKM